MIVGHNPGLHELALALAADGRNLAARTLAEIFPTAAAAVFENGARRRLQARALPHPAARAG